MKTIPDAIDDMKELIKKIIDKPLSWIEHIGSKMNTFAWTKDGPIEKTDMDIEIEIYKKEELKCKKCFHPCHCLDGLHADEYGLCTCEECKC